MGGWNEGVPEVGMRPLLLMLWLCSSYELDEGAGVKANLFHRLGSKNCEGEGGSR